LTHWHCFGCNQFSYPEPAARQRTLFTATQLADPDRPTYEGTPIVTDWVAPGGEVVSTQVNLELSGGGVYRCVTYDFGGDVGRVIHMVPNLVANMGIDEMFISYQTQNIPFRRYRMATGKSIGFGYQY
jgi:hypothetical protein